MKNLDDYIAQFPQETQKLLQQVREAILETAPGAVESISYAMPAYKLNGKPLVYFAGYKNHIGFYATPTGHEAFKDELSKYKQGKGSVQFPVSEPMPLDLIKRIVAFRAANN
ncbi:iron chaperone [Flavobacterium sp. RHBU_24]|uniref:iron chaperone n=1 Tax=Flavobacterium sp. RHBU_24 TaxID=3391185 RepID=UPI0039846DF9